MLKKKIDIYRLVLILFAGVCLVLNMMQGFNNVLWCDEIASVAIAKQPCLDLIRTTAMDVHPPLYYLILRLLGLIFGFSGPICHMVSIIPYVIILILSLTLIWKELGKITAAVLVSLSSLLYCSMHFNVEIRMYTWASLFILLSYIFFGRIVRNGRKGDYIVFSLFSVLAAYTHYFCIITVAVFYIVIMAIGIRKKHKELKNAVMAWMVTIILYMPWAVSFFCHYSSTTEKIYSARYNSVLTCIEYIFSSRFSWLLLGIYLVLLLLVCIKYASNAERIWMISGFVAVVSTIFVPYAISAIMSPIMEERHVYPSFIIAWIILGYCVSKCKRRIVLFAGILVLIVPTGLIALAHANEDERNSEKAQNSFLEKTIAIRENSEIVISNEWQITYPLLQYYYSKDDSKLYMEDEDDIWSYLHENSKKVIWLFMKDGASNGLISKLQKGSGKFDIVVENGLLGSMRIWVYRYEKL